VTSEILSYVEVIGLIFAAGIFYAGVKKMRSDLTGVRKVVNENIKLERRRFHQVLATMLVTVSEEHRELILQMLREDQE
jgi:hypothetical protein